MKTMNEKIAVRDDVDHFSREEVILGDLTEKQYESLEKVIALSPGYNFEVVRYEGGPSSTSTHIKVWRDDNDRGEVGLVGKDTFQFYDKSKTTYAVCRRVAHKVYRKSFWVEDTSDLK